MSAHWAEPVALRLLAAAVRACVATLHGVAVGAASSASAPAVDAVAPAVAGASRWADAWAGSLDERATLLDRHQLAVTTATLSTRTLLEDVVAGREHAMLTPAPLRRDRWERLVLAALADFDLLERSGVEDAVLASYLATLEAGLAAEMGTRRPGTVASLPGAPLVARFAANRRRIVAAHAALTDLLADAEPGQERRLRDERAMLAAFLQPGRNFVVFDWEGAGRIAEWIGPIDAEHVALVVPGTGSSKTTVERIAHDAATMLEHDPSGGHLAIVTATVYDAPDWLAEAALRRYAEAGAPNLLSLFVGLPLAGRHVTIVGHSYGSVVVGEALTDGLAEMLGPDDDVVLIGSPGVGVDTAADLGLMTGRVWAGLLPRDEVQAAVHPLAILGLVGCATPPAPVGGGTAGCDITEWLVHGRNPTHPSFGAGVFAAGAGSLGILDLHHRGYWATEGEGGSVRPSVALANLMRIVTGRYDEVVPPGVSSNP